MEMTLRKFVEENLLDYAKRYDTFVADWETEWGHKPSSNNRDRWHQRLFPEAFSVFRIRIYQQALDEINECNKAMDQFITAQSERGVVCVSSATVIPRMAEWVAQRCKKTIDEFNAIKPPHELQEALFADLEDDFKK